MVGWAGKGPGEGELRVALVATAADPQGRCLLCTPRPALHGLASFTSTLRALLFPLLLQQEGGVAGGSEGSLAGHPAPRQLPSGATVPEHQLALPAAPRKWMCKGRVRGRFSELPPGPAAALDWSAPWWRAGPPASR